ncbi:MAG: hypothetical protein WB780_23325 [Candidatus Acidiferrales bacterium]
MNAQAACTLRERGILLTAGELREITARDGIDAATTLLYRCVLDSSEHGPFIRRIDEIAQRESPRAWTADATLVIVPGAFYRENRRSGADGRILREIAERLGCPTDLIPIASRGSLRQNARIICDWLTAHRRQPVILASLSKGGADVKMAMAQPDAAPAFENVTGWINLCGILDGTPMAEWLLSCRLAALLNRAYFTLRGQGLGFLRELYYAPGCPLDFELRLPAHVRMVTVAGFPLSKHMSTGLARRCHQRLASFGPNDGSLILADVCALPGLIYPLWGADHYLRPQADVRELVLAVLQFLGEETRWHLSRQF